MGLGSRGGGGNYLKIYDGSIVKEWRNSKPDDSDIPEGKEIENRKLTMGKNQGNTVWFVRFDFLTGLLTKATLEDGDYGESIQLTIQDVDDVYILQFNADSSYGSSFLQKAHQIKLEDEVTFEPWSMTKEEWFDFTGKTTKSGKSGLSIKQDWAITDDNKKGSLDNTFTKDDPQGMPDLVVKTDRKGNKTYDSTDMDNFLLNKLEEWIASNFSGGTVNTSPKTTARPSTKGTAKPDTKKEPVDLPFK